MHATTHVVGAPGGLLQGSRGCKLADAKFHLSRPNVARSIALPSAAFGTVIVAHPFRKAPAVMGEYLNVVVRLSAPLAQPVHGVLAPSYNAALAAALERPQAAGVGAAHNISFSAEVRGP